MNPEIATQEAVNPDPRDTKDRILDAAEVLFAQYGFDGASLRAITQLASVNLAAVNYHFQTKEALLKAVYLRRLRPLNADRLARLDQLESQAQGHPIPPAAIVRALIAPAFAALEAGNPAIALMGRAFADPSDSLRAILPEILGEVAARFLAALRQSLPHIPPDLLACRMHFVIGSMAITLMAPNLLESVSHGRARLPEHPILLEELVQFTAAGLAAERGAHA